MTVGPWVKFQFQKYSPAFLPYGNEPIGVQSQIQLSHIPPYGNGPMGAIFNFKDIFLHFTLRQKAIGSYSISILTSQRR